MLNVIILSVVMLNVVMLVAVTPKNVILVFAFGPCSLKHFPYNRKLKCLQLSVTITLVLYLKAWLELTLVKLNSKG
jgi:hypothetical protein